MVGTRIWRNARVYALTKIARPSAGRKRKPITNLLLFSSANYVNSQLSCTLKHLYSDGLQLSLSITIREVWKQPEHIFVLYTSRHPMTRIIRCDGRGGLACRLYLSIWPVTIRFLVYLYRSINYSYVVLIFSNK